MNEQNTRISIDYTLIFLIVLLGAASVFTLYTLTPVLPEKFSGINFPLGQLTWFIAGSFIIFCVMLIDYDQFQKITWIIYTVGLVPLLMIFFRIPSSLMVDFNGIIRGIEFPVIGSLQPAEYMKIIVILTLAHVVARHNAKYVIRTYKSDLLLLLKIAGVLIPPVGLIAVQPDLGSTLVIMAIAACMILVSGIRWRIIFSVIGAGIVTVGLTIAAYFLLPGRVSTFLQDSVFKHVESRFYGWLEPELYSASGYQLMRTMRAIGSGQLFGKGINNMEVNVPERHTDMIFTAVGEQFGFIGVSLLLIIYFLLIYRLLHIALQSNDKYGSYIITGLIGMFTYQIFQNIGMSVQLLPVTGIPLPFMSYGGSSVMSYMFAIAIALNIHSRTKKYMFDDR